MENISYSMIKQLIDKNKSSSCFISREIADHDMQKKLLSLYLNIDVSNLAINGVILKYDFANFEVIEYETITGMGITKNMIVLNDGKENPLLIASQSQRLVNNSGVISEEYKIYDKNNRISFSMNVVNKIIDGSVIQTLVNLKERNLHNISQYLCKHYDFLYSDNQCIIFGLDNDYKSLGEESFINRIEIANSHIQKMGVIFESYVNSSFGLESEAKIYQIKRKVRK